MSEDELRQKLFVALADPTRRHLIETLSLSGEKTATELAQDLTITRQGVSKHMKLLLDANLVSVRQAGRDRYYQLDPDALEAATNWVKRVQSVWQSRLNALSRFLDEESLGEQHDDQ